MPTTTSRTSRVLPAAAALAAAAALTAAAPAAADSIVFVKDHDVWLAAPDGSNQYRVTLDGTAQAPYQSPSQADDGTIVAMRGGGANGAPMLRMKQNGEVLNTISPGAMGGSIHGATAGPFHPHVSPDGRHVAFDIAQGGAVNYYYETATDVRIVKADGSAPGQYEQVGTRATGASWLDGSRLFVGTGPVANVRPVGGTLSPWWSDYDHRGSFFGNGEDLHDGEVAPGRAAMVRGYVDGKSLQLYATDGPQSGVPYPTCTVSDPADGPNGRRFADPTFSPDGTRIAYQAGDGIWTFAQPDPRSCDVTPRLLIPGASQPDWGPADVNPGPRPRPAADGPAAPAAPVGSGGETAGQAPTGPGRSGGETGDQPRPQTAKPAPRLRVAAARRGRLVIVTGRATAPGLDSGALRGRRVTVQLNRGRSKVATARAVIGRGGRFTARLRPRGGRDRLSVRVRVAATSRTLAAVTAPIRVR